jgi:hypothetical protein
MNGYIIPEDCTLEIVVEIKFTSLNTIALGRLKELLQFQYPFQFRNKGVGYDLRT